MNHLVQNGQGAGKVMERLSFQQESDQAIAASFMRYDPLRRFRRSAFRLYGDCIFHIK